MRFFVLAAVALLIWSITGFVVSQSASNQMNQEEIKKALTKELPTGTSRTAVVDYLNKHHVENSSAASSSRPDELLAIYRNVNGSTPVVAKAVQVVFRFKNDTLVSFSVKEKLTGP
jgi:hypothetical protein